MPLAGENRRLVRDGLVALSRTSRPGLRALMTVAKADPSALDTGSLGFRLAPRINAAGRLRRADAGLELLLTGDEQRAAEIAAELDRVNAERRTVEQRIVWEAETQVAELGERFSYVLAGEGWHPGVVGIVASRIVERHHRPVVVVALDGDVGSGSARSIPGFDLLGALHASAEHLDRYGGHRAAAGLSIRRDRLDGFRERDRAARRGGPAPRAAGRARAGRRDRLGMRARPRAGRGARAARAVRDGQPAQPAARARGAAARPAADGGGAPRALRRRVGRNQRTRGRVRVRRAAAASKPTSPSTRPSASSATSGTARSSRGSCSATPDRVRRTRSRSWGSRRTTCGRRSSPRSSTRRRNAPVAGARTVLDRRGHSPLAVLRDAVAAGGGVLAVCADVPRRRSGLSARTGGFALISYHALAREPRIGERFVQLVALDPPAGPEGRRCSAQAAGSPIWRGASLSYALHSRCTSWSTVSVLRSSPSTAT